MRREYVSKLEDRVVEITKAEQKKRILKQKYSIRDLWDHTKHSNSHITGVTEGKEKENRADNLIE